MPPKKDDKKDAKVDAAAPAAKDAKGGKKKEEKKEKAPKKEKKIKEEEEQEGPKVSPRKKRKNRFKTMFEKAISEYHSCLIVGVDNVGSHQMQQVRMALRGNAVVVMGKNTMIRKILTDESPNNKDLLGLLPHVKGNIGFVFTNGDLNQVRKIVLDNKVPAAAKSGSYAPVDVVVPPGPTGLDPGQTSFFQALNIPTKIAKGTIEITNQVLLVKAGDKCTSSTVALLAKLNIKPFFYGFAVGSVFEKGAVYPASVLDFSQDDLLAKFFSGVSRLAAISLEIGYPNLATIPHHFGNAFKKILAISLATDYDFAEAKEFKDFLSNPEAMAAAAAAHAGPAASSSSAAPAAAAAEEAPAEEEEADFGLGGGLFGDD